jgi:hypothetical protein
MAKTTFEIETKLTGGGDSVKSLKELKQEFNEIQKELSGLQPNTQKYIDTLKRLGSVKDEIGDLRDEIGAFAGEGAKFGAVSKAIGGVASGFQAAQGAAALFGSESEDLQKSLLKVQAAMALAEGVKGIAEMGDAFKIVKAVAIDAFKAIKAAITSTGIGALLVVLGTIVAYWDEIKEAVSGVNEEQKKLLETQQSSAKETEKALNDVSKQENILKLMGKTEKEILNLKIEKSKVAITDLEAQLATQESMKAAQIESAERNQSILRNIFRFGLEASAISFRVLAAPIDLLITTANKVAEILGFQKITTFSINAEITKLTSSAAEYGSKLLFDPEEVKSKADETIQTTKEKLQELKNQQAGFQLAIQEIDKQAAEKEKANAAEKRKLIDEEYQWRLNSNREALRRQAEMNKEFEDERRKKQEEADKLEAERIEAEIQAEQKRLDKQKADRLKAVEDYKKSKEQELQLTIEGFKTISALADAFANKSTESQKKAFQIKKAASIAQATVETYQSAQSAYASQMTIPTPDAPIRANIAAAIAIASGLARVAVIAKQKFESPSTGGGGVGGGNLGSFSQGGGQPPQGLTSQNTVTQLNPDGTVASQGQRQAAPVKAYVVESESRAVTERVNKLSNNSKIG